MTYDTMTVAQRIPSVHGSRRSTNWANREAHNNGKQHPLLSTYYVLGDIILWRYCPYLDDRKKLWGVKITK